MWQPHWMNLAHDVICELRVCCLVSPDNSCVYFFPLGTLKYSQDLFVQRECHHLICRSVIQQGNSCCGYIIPGIFWILCFQSRVFPHNISRYQTRQTFPCLVGLRLRQTMLEFAPLVCESEPVCVFTVARHWQTSFLRSRTTWTVAVYPSVYLSIFLSFYLSVFTCVSVTVSPLATLLTTCSDHLSPLGGCEEL